MARKKTRVIPFAPPVVETAVPVQVEIEPTVGDEPVVTLTYSFQTKSRCPKCKSLSTRATSTQGQIQHRRCLRPSCRTTYKEFGTTL
jgi:hypothetical protein